MPEAVKTYTFESLDFKSLGAFVIEKNRDLRAYCEASKDKWDADRLSILKSRNEELEAAQARYAQLQEANTIYDRAVAQQKAIDDPNRVVPFSTGKPSEDQPNGRTMTVNGATKSLGEMFTDSQAYKSIGSHEFNNQPYKIELADGQDALKTTMTTSAGYAPVNARTDVVIPFAVRQPMIQDLVPVVQTDLATIKWMEETTVLAGTAAQISIAEGNTKFENTLAFTERNNTVEVVATYLPVTQQQLDDVSGIQGIINNRLTDFLRRAEEDLLLNGTGSTPQILGFLQKSGTNSVARTTESNIDIVWAGIQACRVTGFAEPDAIVMHPNNFTPIRLYKASTGEYGFDVTSDTGGLVRLFGKPLILTTAIAQGTCLVGAFRLFSQIWRRMGITVGTGFINDDFVKNKKTILAELREALTIYRASAFSKITNLQ